MRIDAEHVTDSQSVVIEELRDGQGGLWDAFVDAHPRGSLYHRTVWRQLIADVFGHETRYLSARRPGAQIVGALPLVRLRSRLFGDFLVSMPYFNYGGAIAISPEIEEALMARASELARNLGCGHVEFRDTAPRNESWPFRTDKLLMELPLPQSEDALWSSLNSKVRTQIRYTAKAQPQVLFGGEELLSDFYHVLSHNMRDLGTPVYSYDFFQAILARFPGSASIAVVKLQNQTAAAAFLIGYRDRLEVPWGASLKEYNRFKIYTYFTWEILKHAIARGCAVYDFGRSTAGSGPHQFKKKWGAAERQLYWHYWLPDGGVVPQLNPDNPKYRLAIRVWQHLPVWLANRLGPPIVQNLP